MGLEAWAFPQHLSWRWGSRATPRARFPEPAAQQLACVHALPCLCQPCRPVHPALALALAPLAAITLFEVFLHILETHSDPKQPFPSVWGSIPLIIEETLK